MVTLVRRLWTEPAITFHGRFFNVTESPMVALGAGRPPCSSGAPALVGPRLLIGGGGGRRAQKHFGE